MTGRIIAGILIRAAYKAVAAAEGQVQNRRQIGVSSQIAHFRLLNREASSANRERHFFTPRYPVRYGFQSRLGQVKCHAKRPVCLRHRDNKGDAKARDAHPQTAKLNLLRPRKVPEVTRFILPDQASDKEHREDNKCDKRRCKGVESYRTQDNWGRNKRQ